MTTALAASWRTSGPARTNASASSSSAMSTTASRRLIGRLLHDTNSLPEGKLAELKAISDKRGMPVRMVVPAGCAAGRARPGHHHRHDADLVPAPPSARYVIIDAPGHKEFLKNMISGARPGRGRDPRHRRGRGRARADPPPCAISAAAGHAQIAVAVNKIDLIGFDQARFDAIAREITDYLRQLELSRHRHRAGVGAPRRQHRDQLATRCPGIRARPCSRRSTASRRRRVATDQPLRLPIQDVYQVRRAPPPRRPHRERPPRASAIALVFAPSFKQAKVASIETWNAPTPITAGAGQSVAITLDDELFIERGHVAVHSDRRPILGHRASLRIFWLDAQAAEGRRPAER